MMNSVRMRPLWVREVTTKLSLWFEGLVDASADRVTIDKELVRISRHGSPIACCL